MDYWALIVSCLLCGILSVFMLMLLYSFVRCACKSGGTKPPRPQQQGLGPDGSVLLETPLADIEQYPRQRSLSIVSVPPPVYVRTREEDRAGVQPPAYQTGPEGH